MFPNEEGIVVSPPAGGATNWMSPTYSPRTGLLYVMSYDGEAQFFIRDEEYVEGDRFIGGGQQQIMPAEEYTSAVRAIDPRTGDLRWEYRVQPWTWAGLLGTAGDLVFGGSIDGYFYALDAVSGEQLWYMAVGAQVRAAPITYAVDGEQYVAIAAGNVVYAFGLDDD